MRDNKNNFVKTDDDIIINKKYIKWIKKVNECLNVCIKTDGCSISDDKTTHKICKSNNKESYARLNKYFF